MSLSETTAIQVAGQFLGVLGLVLSGLFVRAYARKKEVKMLATDVLLVSMVISDAFTCVFMMLGMISLMSGATDCSGFGFMVTAGLVTYSIHSVMIPGVFSYHLSKEYVMPIRTARITVIVLWGLSFVWAGLWAAAAGNMIAPGDTFCLPNVVPDYSSPNENSMGALVLLLVMLVAVIPLQLLCYATVYCHTKRTFTSADERFDVADEVEEYIPGVSTVPQRSTGHTPLTSATPPRPALKEVKQERENKEGETQKKPIIEKPIIVITDPQKKEEKPLFVRVAAPEGATQPLGASNLLPDDIRRRQEHRKILRRVIWRTSTYLGISLIRIVSFLVAAYGNSFAEMAQFMLVIVLSPSLTVLAYGVGNPEYRRSILRCARIQRGSESGSQRSSSGSQARVSVAVNAETKAVNAADSGEVTYLDDGLKIVIDKETKVSTLEGLTIRSLLSYSLGVDLALTFDEEKNLQCRENILFCTLVRQYKELAADSSDRRAPWEHGKRIVREYMSGKVYKANIKADLCESIRTVFAPSFRNVTGKEFDVALREVTGMLDDTFGFMGQFKKSPRMLELARHLANQERERKTDVKHLAIRDLRNL